MLGEIISEERGKITSVRVLPGGMVPHAETSFTASGTLLGIAVQDMGTYESFMRPDGTIAGEGQGMTRGADGSTASWKGIGVGAPKPDGSVNYRGSCVFSTTSTKWARLNSCALLFEFDVDSAGNVSAKGYEWR